MSLDFTSEERERLLKLSAELIVDRLMHDGSFGWRLRERVEQGLFEKLSQDPGFQAKAVEQFLKTYEFKLLPMCEKAIKPAVASIVAKEIGGRVAELGNEFAERVLAPMKSQR